MNCNFQGRSHVGCTALLTRFPTTHESVKEAVADNGLLETSVGIPVAQQSFRTIVLKRTEDRRSRAAGDDMNLVPRFRILGHQAHVATVAEE